MIKTLPALFEEFINTSGLNYHAIKLSKNKFLGFAFNEQEIIDMIKKSGLENSQIVNIYFAQTELQEYYKQNQNSVISIKNKQYTLIDNIIVQIPKSLQSTQIENLDISIIALSKYKIPINFSSKYISIGSSYILSGVFLLFTLFNITQISYNYYNSLNNIPTKIKQFKRSVNLPTTMLQTKSIIKSMENISYKQKRLRETLAKIFSLKYQAGVYLLNCSIKNKQLTLEYVNGDINKIKILLSKSYKISKIVKLKNSVRVEIKL